MKEIEQKVSRAYGRMVARREAELKIVLTVRRSWACTWPLLGTFALTIVIWVIAN